jgi:hypothetical protein
MLILIFIKNRIYSSLNANLKSHENVHGYQKATERVQVDFQYVGSKTFGNFLGTVVS